jgi:2-polyprenyl-3-methyl-5-hydroxy-6-metoxy-1,4-benzoquinol methylase
MPNSSGIDLMHKPNHQSHLTAISRKTIPTPVKWVLQNYTISGKVLDFGCGKCASINPSHWDNYDPYYNPNGIKQKKYDTIFCTYVLCTLPKSERQQVLKQIISLLEPIYGVAFISVRNDTPKQGWGLSKRNTYQGRATELDKMLLLLYSNSQYRIYILASPHS